MSALLDGRSPPDDPGFNAALNHLRSVLVSGETITAVALQHRLYALTHRRNLAAAVTGRFIAMNRNLLGGYQLASVRWQDLKAVRISVGMITATLVVDYSGNLSDTAVGEGETRSLALSGLEIEPAQALYRECQGQEQSWREKRRVRSIEEMRAAAGGVQIATGVYPPPARDAGFEAAAPPLLGEDPTARLARARDMLSRGLISDSEFEAIKAKIIGAL